MGSLYQVPDSTDSAKDYVSYIPYVLSLSASTSSSQSNRINAIVSQLTYKDVDLIDMLAYFNTPIMQDQSGLITGKIVGSIAMTWSDFRSLMSGSSYVTGNKIYINSTDYIYL